MRHVSIIFPVPVIVLGWLAGCGGSEGTADEVSTTDASVDAQGQAGQAGQAGEAGVEDSEAGKVDTGSGGAEPDGSSCVDECESEGMRGCHEGGLRTCGQYDADSCLEWSDVEVCPDGLVCDPSTVTCREACLDHCDPFSIVLVPDPQNYSSKQDNNASNTYRKQTQWMVDHWKSDNIQMVVHLGDNTNHNEESEWKVGDAAFATLDKAGMPYSMTTGNHDYLVKGAFQRGGSLFDKYFGKSRFEGKPWYGGSYGSSNINNYTTFQVGTMKFLVLSLEFAPRKDVLCWAHQVIANHPDYHVIIATHCYLTHGGGYSGCPDPKYTTTGAAGGTTFKELASRHSNVFLVVSGHINDSEYRVRKGNLGNDVHQMVVDYQMEGPCAESKAADCKNHCRAGGHTGNGWLRKLVFDPRNNTIQAETFSVEEGNKKVFPGGKPTLFCSELFKPSDPNATGDNWYASDPNHSDHRFQFAFDMTSPVSYAYDDAGQRAFMDRTVNSVGTGDQLVPRVALAPTGSHVIVWQDDSSSADGAGNHDIMARGFEPGGCAGFADIVVNQSTAGHQHSPAIAMDSQGNFVVAWVDDPSHNGNSRIRARGFSADGKERFAEFVVSATGTAQQRHPAIAMAPDGNFVIVWEQGPVATAQIAMKGFSANGSERFASQSVHSDVLGQRIHPSVAMDGASNFVVVWQDDSDANGSYQIHARGFHAAGTERFARMTINSVAAGQQRDSVIGMANSGAFVVAWADDQNKTGNHQILARGFSAQGQQTIADFQVHEKTGKYSNPRIAMEPNGAFVIAWQADGGATAGQAQARSFLANGSEWRPQWKLHRVESGDQLTPDIAINATGSLVATWADDMDGNGAMQILSAGFDSP
ncbi:MAG TPA: metallophosphoesterase [Polyangiaceae bacterium]|jgi:predicted phosphodiesterase|nr:MAG: Calcineurin-like phosphoesterase [Deltaproteobacteria bacterium ADurb.Bin207]HNZ24151.1 metallophosphoesterase [Polyangiaceae bacterium]HOD23816.1 metallophosphoesterase [Polyangiaceae bacterium]HOE48757.1 metallophosphoesterase [Polyangiaceae bacterium]HOH02167.1 metallophosphoesterase [Polyangiaceae bacterium]